MGGAPRHDLDEYQIRHQLETTLLDSAHIVCTTLNSAGHPCMEATMPFNVVIIDEAAQAVELSTLIPLNLGPSTCVLVGDPQQLPATTFAHTSKFSQYQRSLFERLESGGHRARMLAVQYRMHPAISHFPRTIFYDSQLQDGPNVHGTAWRRAFHSFAAFRPFTFLNLETTSGAASSESGAVDGGGGGGGGSGGDRNGAEHGGACSGGGRGRGGGGGRDHGGRGGGRGGRGASGWPASTKRSNPAEARLALNVYLTLKRLGERPGGDPVAGRVGIITPYRDQLSELRRVFERHASDVELNTVDGYQGREKDIIIFSCVRAANGTGVGFLADVRRMNVALTRARVGMFILGSEAALRSNSKWSSLLQHARATGVLVDVPGGDPQCDLLSIATKNVPKQPTPPSAASADDEDPSRRGAGGGGTSSGGAAAAPVVEEGEINEE